MKKLFISADIEGTAGICHWNETEPKYPEYAYFAAQMTREVAAACEGAVAAGYDEIVIKDAHDNSRNIDPSKLPECARVIRGKPYDPLSMMYGIDKSFSGVAFTGYHSAAQMNTNPLSHTRNLRNNYITINGELASELMMNGLVAGVMGVPVFLVTGDAGICTWMKETNHNVTTVPTNEGHGGAALSIHPDVAVRRIREAASTALLSEPKSCTFTVPEHFTVDVNFKEHFYAQSAGFYPGARQIDSRTVRYESDDFMDVMTFFYFTL